MGRNIAVEEGRAAVGVGRRVSFIVPTSGVSSLRTNALMKRITLSFKRRSGFPATVCRYGAGLSLGGVGGRRRTCGRLPGMCGFKATSGERGLLRGGFGEVCSRMRAMVRRCMWRCVAGFERGIGTGPETCEVFPDSVDEATGLWAGYSFGS